jgi:hypothetical protein
MRNYAIFKQYILKFVNNAESLKYIYLISCKTNDDIKINQIGDQGINKLTSINNLRINSKEHRRTFSPQNASFTKSSQYFNGN